MALADCQPAIRLKVGDTVKDCERIGLSLDADLQIRQDLIESDYNKKIIEAQKKQLELKDLLITDQKARGDLWQADALREREYADKMKARESTSFWIGLGVGILTVVAAGYAVGQVSK